MRAPGEGRARPLGLWVDRTVDPRSRGGGSPARPGEGVAMEPEGRGENLGGMRRGDRWRGRKRKAALWLGPAQEGAASVFSGRRTYTCLCLQCLLARSRMMCASLAPHQQI